MAPLLAHELLLAASASSSSSSPSPPPPTSTPAPNSTTPAAAALPYRWMLVGRDDTLWLPHTSVRLLAPYGAAAAAAVSDHVLDFNGRRLLAPSPAAAVCLPCGMNLTALLGRRRPPRVPVPACPVCRPAAGCEFRFNLCGGLAGGRTCGSKRFLGSGDRCVPSWVAGGGGVALSAQLLTYLDKDDWASCVLRGVGSSTGERSLARCLWRHGFALTHPAAGLAAGLTREPLSPQHVLFGNPLAREALFGNKADQLLGPAYSAADAASTRAAVAAAATATPAASGPTAAVVDGAAAAAFFSVPSSTRVTPAAAAAEEQDAAAAAALACNATCAAWVRQNAVSAHLDVPYGGGSADGGVDTAAAAALMEEAARAVAKAAGWER